MSKVRIAYLVSVKKPSFFMNGKTFGRISVVQNRRFIGDLA